MTVEVTYAQYQSAIPDGKLTEAAFDSLLPRAAATVDYLIGINEVTDEGKYREAVFASMTSLSETGVVGGGFSIGSFSLNSRDSDATPDQLATAAAYKVLATTGMIYGGIA